MKASKKAAIAALIAAVLAAAGGCAKHTEPFKDAHGDSPYAAIAVVPADPTCK